MMKAAVIHRYGAPSEFCIEEMAVPKIKSTQVLVRVSHVSINPIEMLQRKGKHKLLTGFRFPKILGSDYSGIIEEVGSDVERLAVGDRVFGMTSTLTGQAYAEYIAVGLNEVVKIPQNFSSEEAAGLPLVGLTTIQGFKGLVHLSTGCRVLINGSSGGVGVYAVQIAKALGAEVTAVCSHRNVELMHELGADEVFDYTTTDLVEIDKEFDIFYDVFGNYSFGSVAHLLRPNGTYITTIPNPKNFADQLVSKLSTKSCRVVIVRPDLDDLLTLQSMCEEDKIKPIIDSTFELSQMAEAHDKLQTKRARGKIIIKVADF